MTIAEHSFQIALTPSGQVDSRYINGIVPSPTLVWATIPAFSSLQGTPFAVNVRTGYLSGSGAATAVLALVGTPPAGWSLVGDNLTYSGVGTGAGTVQVSASLSGSTVFSVFFTISATAVVTADVTPPTVPTGLAGSGSTSGTVAISADASSDPFVPNNVTSGLKDSRLRRDGSSTVLQTYTYPSAGLSSVFTGQDVGTVALSGSSVQSGTNWTLTGSGLGFNTASADGFQFASAAVVGDDTLIVKVTSVAGASLGKAGLMFRTSSAAGAPFVSITVSESGVISMDARFTSNTNAGNVASASGFSGSLYLKLTRVFASNAFTGFYSPTGNNWTQFGTTTNAMPSAILGGLAVSSQNNTLATAVLSQSNSQNIPGPTFTDTGVSVGTHTYTISARDQALNESVQSPSISVTVSAVGPGVKWHPGHYALSNITINAQNWGSKQSQVFAEIDVALKNNPNVLGYILLTNWGALETGAGVYGGYATIVDVVRMYIQTNYPGKRMGIMIPTIVYGTTDQTEVIPAHVLSNPAYGASPDSGQYGYWRYSGSFNSVIAAIWRPAVAALQSQMFQALAARTSPYGNGAYTYDTDPFFEIVSWNETSTSINGNSDYQQSNFVAQWQSVVKAICSAFQHTLYADQNNYLDNPTNTGNLMLADTAVGAAVSGADVYYPTNQMSWSYLAYIGAANGGTAGFNSLIHQVPCISFVESPDYNQSLANMFTSASAVCHSSHIAWEVNQNGTGVTGDFASLVVPFINSHPIPQADQVPPTSLASRGGDITS